MRDGCLLACAYACVCARPPAFVGVQARGRVNVRVCVRVVLIIHHATGMRNLVLSFAASLAPPHFSTLCQKRHDFYKKVIEIKYVV